MITQKSGTRILASMASPGGAGQGPSLDHEEEAEPLLELQPARQRAQDAGIPLPMPIQAADTEGLSRPAMRLLDRLEGNAQAVSAARADCRRAEWDRQKLDRQLDGFSPFVRDVMQAGSNERIEDCAATLRFAEEQQETLRGQACDHMVAVLERVLERVQSARPPQPDSQQP